MKSEIQDVELTVAQEQPTETEAMKLDVNLVKHLDVKLNARIGSATLSVGHLSKLKEGEILVLDEAVNSPIELELNGVVVAEGMLVAQDGKYAIQVTNAMSVKD